MKKQGLIDLHIHSNYSDGALSPEEIFQEAKNLSLKMISITDHDTPNDLAVIQPLVDNNDDYLIYVPGVEVSCTYIDRKSEINHIHILGYGCSDSNYMMKQILEYQKSIRVKVNKQYIETLISIFPELTEELFSNLNCSQYFRLTRAIISNLNSRGLSKNIISEVEKYCNKQYPIYKEYDVDSKETIDAIINANGIPILAHPLDYDLREVDVKRLIKSMLDAGVEGFEAYSSTYTHEEMKHLRMMAESYKVLYSCGSDFHFRSNDSKMKVIGYGIDNNLCQENTSLSDEILKRSLQLKKVGQ